jgi:hypothetical protein
VLQVQRFFGGKNVSKLPSYYDNFFFLNLPYLEKRF